MITLKESILSRSSHSGEGFKAQRREMIEKWLKEYDIEDYTIKDDFTININGGVDLVDRELKELPDYIQFRVVNGRFDCSRNELTSLRGCPREVKGSFCCNDNQLTSLEGAPLVVGICFDCSSNKLTSLEGAPKEVGRSFYCSCNQLVSLEGAPKEVGEYFICSSNLSTFTEEDVRKVCNVEGPIVF